MKDKVRYRVSYLILHYHNSLINIPDRACSLLLIPFFQVSLLKKYAFSAAMMAVTGVSRQYDVAQRTGMRSEGILATIAGTGVYNRTSAKVAVISAEMMIATNRAKQGSSFPIGFNDAIAQQRPATEGGKAIRSAYSAVGRTRFPNRRVAVRTNHGLWLLHDPPVHPQHIMKPFPHQALSKR